jgi:hypothetical protein
MTYRLKVDMKLDRLDPVAMVKVGGTYNLKVEVDAMRLDYDVNGGMTYYLKAENEWDMFRILY